MNLGFWGQLPRPILALAPMINVTDAAFRKMFVECGKPDVFWTEFVSVEGLLSRGRDALLPMLWFDEREHPIVAQIFGVKPKQFEEVGEMIRKLGFDGVDINMGCPDRDVEKQGAGAALIKNKDQAKEIIRALKKGADPLPVSVKTRLGYASSTEATEWIRTLLEEDIAEISVHLRTRKEMSLVPAHWEIAPEIVAMRNKIVPKTLVLGNGDISSLDEANLRIRESGMDGVMIGRGIFGNPWFFSGRVPDASERLERMVIHAKTYEEMYGERKNFSVMKKHFNAYATGFFGAKDLRIRLMEVKNAGDVSKIVKEFLRNENEHI